MPPDEPLIRFGWIADNLDVIGRRLGEHLVMTVIAVLGGFFISFALALLIRRHRRVHGPVLAVSGVLYTIPSLALFALLIPFTGLSLLSAEVALVSYTVLILVRNIVAGFESVPADVVEAANGMGYTSWQRLWSIDLPLAAPIIVAGLRIATVTTIRPGDRHLAHRPGRAGLPDRGGRHPAVLPDRHLRRCAALDRAGAGRRPGAGRPAGPG